MPLKKNKKSRMIMLVSLPVIIVLLVLILNLIERSGEKTETEASSVAEPETEPEAEPESEPETAVNKLVEPVKVRGRVFLVIDDVGYNLDQLEKFLNLECPLTFAVIPFLPYSNESAQRITRKVKEYIIHMPMEPLNGEDPGPGALLTSMTEEEIRQSTRNIVSSLSGAKGVNNHMGSRFTSDSRSMDIVLQELKVKGIFYLDSYTTAESVVNELSAKNGMVYHKRDIFIDNNSDSKDMEKAFREGFLTAENKKVAILIGHVWSENLPNVIDKLYREGLKMGFQFGYLSELYRTDENS